MSRVITFPRAAILLAGVAAGAVSRLVQSSADKRHINELRQSVADLESRIASHETAQETKLNTVETRLNEHEEKLKAVPTTAQIVSAMEELLSKTMAGLDQRLSTQAHSIEVLKTTVTQTDELLERVLESIDSLRQTDCNEEYDSELTLTSEREYQSR